MQLGDVIADRFELLTHVGEGGMGTVYRANDRASGQHVAVKAMLREGNPNAVRFEREALALMGLSHPGIVRYVGHGTTPASYLVVEWLEGEDLAQVLTHRKLDYAETMTLIRRVVEALAVVHAHGIVHRDLKPSNLFLVDGDPAKVKVLDFGIARVGGLSRMTRTGSTLGTPGYMAPEQAAGQPLIDARVDVFAVGCVLHECLVGAPPFAANHLLAILAKVLFEEVPRLSELCPVPRELDELCARMLAKKAEDRPRDAAELVDALARIGCDDEPASAAPGPALRTLTRAERRLVSVVIMNERKRPLGETLVDTAADMPEASLLGRLRELATKMGARVELVADGSVILTITGSSVATDLVSQAARCALALRELAPHNPIAMSTGSCEVVNRLPLGEAIERAVALLARAAVTLEASQADPASAPVAPIIVDETTAGLLDRRFEVRESASGFELLDELPEATPTRTLLGRPTPFVGRKLELGMLHASLLDAIEESTPHAAIITAPAGLGKSRLIHELLRSVEARDLGVQVWRAHGDLLHAGSAFNMIAQVVRNACGIQEGETLEVRRRCLVERVRRHVAEAETQRVCEFLGELVHVAFPDADSAMLRTARQDPVTMGEQIQRAWEDLLAAESIATPTLIVLEDLHWGDVPTVRFIDAALERLQDRPWMVIALGRPEIHEVFPKLWRERRTHEIRLRPLSAQASQILAKQTLGESVGAETLERVVALADGHPFFLEELVRAVSVGEKDALPDTVVAMVQARLEHLEDDARRVLRAASVFGDVFWAGAVAQLAGETRVALDGLLANLEAQELITRQPRGRFLGEQEFSFRHALVREGAYATLTDEDRSLGHRLAGAWLEAAGETDPLALAEHFERGGDRARAGELYCRSGELAIRGGDSRLAVERVRRGLECGVPDEIEIELRAQVCDINSWMSIYEGADEHFERVRSRSAPGTAAWSRATRYKSLVDLSRGDYPAFMAGIEEVRTAEPSSDEESLAFAAENLAMFVFMMDLAGNPDYAAALVARLRETVDARDEELHQARAWSDIGKTFHVAWIDEDPVAALALARSSKAHFAAGGVRRGIFMAQLYIGMCMWLLGDLDEALAVLCDTQLNDRELGLASALRFFYLVHTLAALGQLGDAQAQAKALIATSQRNGFNADVGRGRWALAEVLRRAGELETAEAEARVALELLAAYALEHASAHATLAAILLARGRASEALPLIEHAAARYEQMRCWGLFGAFVQLTHVEVLAALGAHDRARELLASARARLTANAVKIPDEGLRACYLERVPDHRRLFDITLPPS